MTFERRIDESWDFVTANTKEYTHCYHNYPAMMIPQIARRLIETYKTSNTKLLFDPYCGSGTSLVEAKLQGIESLGTDLNPLARLISKSKTTIYDVNLLRKAKNDLVYKLLHENLGGKDFKLPDFPNIEYWFSEPIIYKLSYLKYLIFNEIDEEIRDFFIIPFSETVREASYTRNSEFKLYRIENSKLETFNVSPFEIFIKKLERNFKGFLEFQKVAPQTVASKIYGFNTCFHIPENIFKGEVDLIVTSPPYGDSNTTVAYGQFSRLSNEWLDIQDARQLDKVLMGGTKKPIIEFPINSASLELTQIRNNDEKRYNEVILFLQEYKASIDNISKIVKTGGIVCYVVGNRTVKGIQIPLDFITAEFFENNNFELLDISIRRIPNKRMPSKNSPTNEIGKVVTTMNNEYIVVTRKL